MKGVLSNFTNYEISAIKHLIRQNYWWEDPYYSFNILSYNNNNEKSDAYYYILNAGFYAVGF